MILDDASRTTASFESTLAFAEHRLEQDLEVLVGDPSMRMGPAADAARARATERRDQLLDEAGARHRADLAQLTAELDGAGAGAAALAGPVVRPGLAAAAARRGAGVGVPAR